MEPGIDFHKVFRSRWPSAWVENFKQEHRDGVLDRTLTCIIGGRQMTVVVRWSNQHGWQIHREWVA